jgi:hypothetical protein
MVSDHSGSLVQKTTKRSLKVDFIQTVRSTYTQPYAVWGSRFLPIEKYIGHRLQHILPGFKNSFILASMEPHASQPLLPVTLLSGFLGEDGSY